MWCVCRGGEDSVGVGGGSVGVCVHEWGSVVSVCVCEGGG